MKKHELKPNEFLMIGNSLKSDILPLVNLGAYAIHIPFHTTWDHEKVNQEELTNKRYIELKDIRSIKNLTLDF